MTDTEFLRELLATESYLHVVLLPGRRYACLNVRWHNTQIITGRVGDLIGYDDAW